jgi:peptidoglycan/LPS O-acetylase OafA/YrhL
MSKEKIYLRNLDSIRFIAALIVFMQHGFSGCYKFLPGQGGFLMKVLSVFSTGGTGVSIFFVLSGFLITYLLISEYEVTGKVSLRNFYIRRMLRIWPLYFAVVIFTFGIYPLLKSLIDVNNPLASRFIYHLTFLSNFDLIHINRCCHGSQALSQDITWSVSIEEQFYAFWPLIFVFMPKRTWIYSIATVIIASIIFRVMNHDDYNVLYFHTLAVLLDLGIGGLFALLVKSFRRIRQFFENSSTITHLLLFLIAFCILMFDNCIFPKGSYAIHRAVTTLSFALIITAQAITKNNSPLNLHKLRFADRWGKYTYGIYLLHPICITLTTVVFRLLHLEKDNLISLFAIGIVSFVFTLTLSRLSYRYYESWFLALKERFAIIKSH